MTCVSLKSGSASRGTLYIGQMPTATAKPINKKTSALLAAENSRMRPIILMPHPRHLGMIGLRLSRRAPQLVARHPPGGGFELAFGIDQERPRGHDALIHLQAAADFNAVSKTISGLDSARLEIPIAAVNKCGFANARIHDRVNWDREMGSATDVKIDIDKHFWLQNLIRIGHFETDFQGARGGVQLRLDIVAAGRERSSLIRRKARGLADSNPPGQRPGGAANPSTPGRL